MEVKIDVEESDDSVTLYEVNWGNRPSFDLVNKVKSEHAERNDVNYRDLVARKVTTPEEEQFRNAQIVVVER